MDAFINNLRHHCKILEMSMDEPLHASKRFFHIFVGLRDFLEVLLKRLYMRRKSGKLQLIVCVITRDGNLPRRLGKSSSSPDSILERTELRVGPSLILGTEQSLSRLVWLVGSGSQPYIYIINFKAAGCFHVYREKNTKTPS